MKLPSALRTKIRGLKALAVDCDGVLTDGRLYYGAEGIALKAFDAKDGYGLVLLRESGVRVAVFSSDRATLLERRAEKLGIADVHQGVRDKAGSLRDFAAQYLLNAAEVGYAGDDLNDLPAIDAAGVSFCPADAVDAVRGTVDVVTVACGGRGAVREIAETILACRRRA